MPRQFGLKRATTAERSAASSVRISVKASQTVKLAEAPTEAQGSRRTEPLYAPASWRGRADRRSVSAS